MDQTLSSNPTPIHKYLLMFLGLSGFCLSLTILYLCMRAVMEVGGYCAEGGPYEIQVHCPQGTAILTPLSIFGIIIFGLTYFFVITPNTINFGYLFWSALFGSLGWNFLDFSLPKPNQPHLVISWLICAIIFILMAIAALYLIFRTELKNDFYNYRNNSNKFLYIILFLSQLLAIAIGIITGNFIYRQF